LTGVKPGATRDEAARADRRQHGHRLLRARGHAAGNEAGIRVRVSRRRPRDEAARGGAALARPASRRRAGRARRTYPQPVVAADRAHLARKLARKLARLEPLVCLKG
jgi:hypothetical protein